MEEQRIRSLGAEKRKIGEYLTATWYFEKAHEKFIMIFLSLIGLYQLFRWLTALI